MTKMIPPKVLGMMEKAQFHKTEAFRAWEVMQQYTHPVRDPQSYISLDVVLPSGEMFTFTMQAFKLQALLSEFRASHNVKVDRLQRRIGDVLLGEEVA